MPGKERRRLGHFRICGACGKRNKARRGECSRCGQPLRGLPEALPGARHAPPPPPRQYRWLVAAVVLAAIAAGFAVHRTFGSGDTLGTAQVAPSAAPPPETAPPAPAAAPTFDPTSAERYARVKPSVERGEKLLARGDFRGAALLLADAARLVPEDPRIAFAYGRALTGLNSRDRALVQFERAARLDTGTVAYRLEYAKALAGAGRVREASREYEAIGALEPGNVAASEALARLQPPAPTATGAEPGTVDMGGASSGSAPAPSRGGAFTNEDLQRGGQPMRPPSPSPRPPTPGPSYLPASPITPPSPATH